MEDSSTEWVASTEILPIINRTSFPGQDVLRRKNRNKNRERYRLKNRDKFDGLCLHLASVSDGNGSCYFAFEFQSQKKTINQGKA